MLSDLLQRLNNSEKGCGAAVADLAAKAARKERTWPFSDGKASLNAAKAVIIDLIRCQPQGLDDDRRVR